MNEELAIDHMKRFAMIETYVTMFANNKGGVGKTTTTLNEAAALAEKGKRVLIIDLDESKNITTHIFVESGERSFTSTGFVTHTHQNIDVMDYILWGTKIDGVALIPSDGMIKKAIQDKVRGNPDAAALEMAVHLKKMIHQLDTLFDYILIDASPSMDVLVQIALTVATHVVYIADGSSYAEQGIYNMVNSEELQFVKKYNPDQKVLGVLLNNMDLRVNNDRIRVDLPEIGGVPRIPLYIPMRTEIRESSHLKDIAVAPGKQGLLAESYRKVADFIIENASFNVEAA